jgi:hypothetical protein
MICIWYHSKCPSILDDNPAYYLYVRVSGESQMGTNMNLYWYNKTITIYCARVPYLAGIA